MTDNKSCRLTKKEIKDLWEISQKFLDIEQFEIVQDHSSGIGISTKVRFNIVGKSAEINITDIESW